MEVWGSYDPSSNTIDTASLQVLLPATATPGSTGTGGSTGAGGAWVGSLSSITFLLDLPDKCGGANPLSVEVGTCACLE